MILVGGFVSLILAIKQIELIRALPAEDGICVILMNFVMSTAARFLSYPRPSCTLGKLVHWISLYQTQ